MKIYTKTGDKGRTSLIGGTKVLKNHSRVMAYGTVDELNSWLGLLRDQPVADEWGKKILLRIQDRLFTIGSKLASDPARSVMELPDLEDSDTELLEQAIDQMEGELPPLKNFILPGGNLAVSHCHIARCICRRAEREVVALDSVAHIEPYILVYLNRLSDFLFVLARKWAMIMGAEEIPWNASDT